ncbi:ABC transporter related (plasmid) [Cupriavidus necator]|uniref:ABC transporter ATP-binding protein n=1 Tax=Cupriavidus necator TaxID=106590 RepID=UPI003F73ABA4
MSIEVDKVVVRFGGLVALQDVSLTLEPGQIVTVIGPNGSGKSTLFNSITGLTKVAGGSVRIDGVDVVKTPPHQRIARGLARSFQTPRFDPRISVEDAVLCGFYPVSHAGIAGSLLRTLRVARQEREFAQACERILTDFKLGPLRGVALGELPMGQVRLVEVARAIAHRPKYLLLDEPAAGLTRAEQQLLADEIRRVAAAGVGVLLVEHNFALVRELSDHAVVLDGGRLLASGNVNELMRDPAFVAAYLGSGQQPAELTS